MASVSYLGSLLRGAREILEKEGMLKNIEWDLVISNSYEGQFCSFPASVLKIRTSTKRTKFINLRK